MNVVWILPVLLYVVGQTEAYKCQSDIIFQLATEKRVQFIEATCAKKDNKVCTKQDELDKAWKSFLDAESKYKTAVASCVAQRQKSKSRAGRSADHDPKDPNIDHTGHNHRRRRHPDHDPNDPNIDHSGHNHRRRRHPNHDPNDPNIDHSGHNHRKRRNPDHDPNDPNIDHSGHNHRRRRHPKHDPNDPNIDHTGHNHRRKRAVDTSSASEEEDSLANRPEPYSEPERQQTRFRRETCGHVASAEVAKVRSVFEDHCAAGNICLPDADLAPGNPLIAQIEKIRKDRAHFYNEFLRLSGECKRQ